MFAFIFIFFGTGSGEMLEIGSLESSDAGSYQCRATNSAGILNSRTATLSVSQFTGQYLKPSS